MFKYNGAEVILKKEFYANNDRVAISMYYNDDPFSRDIITVNLPKVKVTDKRCSFVDTNNHPDIKGWLIENKIAEPTGKTGSSGFCVYPEMRFL